jgi:hypothetical protein
MMGTRAAIILALALGITGPAWALDDTEIVPQDLEPKRVYSPYAGRQYPDRVLFGDLHFHTNLSPDAGLIGTSLGPSDGFRFARGEKVTSNTGQPVQLVRPLDFLAITDHAEVIGLATSLQNSDPLLLADPWGRHIYDLFNSGQQGRMQAFAEILQIAEAGDVNPFSSEALTKSIWADVIATADEYNQPGIFTTFTGFEWTFTPQGDNLHRVVIFADGADKTSQTVPFSFFDGPSPEQLWSYLQNYESLTGGRAIAVPHNGNLSNGLMFSDRQFDGGPMTAEYAARRIRWEPIHEVSQMKGDEETHPLLSPDDEFADFERWDVGNIFGTAPKTPEMLQYEHARSALRLGLKLGRDLGVNPYKLGMNASTDTHTGLSTSREENYFGKLAHTEPSADRFNREVVPAADPSLRIVTAQESASGMTAVWTRENTRKAIFDALTRREVYATTGTRIRVRVFGGWDFAADDIFAPDFVAKGYRNGVPMGGELWNAPAGKAPGFMVQALRDPDGANLDRVQIIKGWLDANGETHEQIYDIAVSDGRQIGEDGRARQPVGTSVDIPTATYRNSIGAASFAAYWSDPEFNPAEDAFYYVRVLEIPTPRWTTYDAAFFGVPLPDMVPPTIQDRAYTSPIWYTPR